MIQQFRLLEAGRGVAVLASGSVVGIAGWLVAVAALVFLCQIQSLVTVQALRFGVFAHQFQRVRIGFHFRPFLCRMVTIVALDGQHRFVGGEVASIAVRELTVELAGHVAVQADRHGTDDVAADGVESMANPAVTVAAGNVRQLAVCDLIVRGAQTILGEFLR
jgi:hypothetical protein